MMIRKFKAPDPRRHFKFLGKLDYIRARNYYRQVCWEIRCLEDFMALNLEEDYRAACRKNLNYLKSQRKAALNYLN